MSSQQSIRNSLLHKELRNAEERYGRGKCSRLSVAIGCDLHLVLAEEALAKEQEVPMLPTADITWLMLR